MATPQATDRDWSHRETLVESVPERGDPESLRLHYVEAGDPDGDPVLLLHGFPELWYAWRDQLPALADAGYRAVAPDLRGYNRSEKPHGVDAYRLDRLVGDVVGLVEALGHESAHVVGHDWGGVIAWELAARRPEVVDRLAVLNAPHPERYERELRSLDQLRRSWYAFWFQVPWLPERLLGAFDARSVGDLLREDPVDPDAFDEEAIRRYREAASRPGALQSAINYYRALARSQVGASLRRSVPGAGPPPGAPRAGRIEVPTLLLWGLQDQALSPRLSEGLYEWIPDLRVRRFDDASHWVQSDAPERINEELVAFLGEE